MSNCGCAKLAERRSSPVFQYYVADYAVEAGVVVAPPRLGDAGFDLPAAVDVVIEAGESALIPTGLHIAVPENWVGLVRDRSSVASRGGVTAAGVIDAGYRGEVKVLMYNLSNQSISFKPGERIAQCLILPHFNYIESERVAELADLGNTERGSGGFGSTGR